MLDFMTQTSQRNQCVRLVKVCVCVYTLGRAVGVGGRRGHQLSFDFKTEHFPRLICLTVIQIVETPNEMPFSLT